MGLAFQVPRVSTAALRALNYSPAVEQLRSKRHRVEELGSLVAQLGRSYWTVFTRHDCDPSHGVELLSQTDMFALEPAGRVIRRDSMASPEDHRINTWDILIAGAGQMNEGNLFGRSIVADERLSGRFLGPHAVCLRFPEPGSNLNCWTYAYLNTSVGLAAVKSVAFGTSVPGLRLDLLRNVPVPIPDDRTLSLVSDLVRSAVRARSRYLAGLLQARQMVAGTPDSVEALRLCRARRARCAIWDQHLPTLSAWNFASAGEALRFLRNRWDRRFADVLEPNGVFMGPRHTRISCSPPHGIDFMSQRDVFLVRSVPRRIVHPGCPDRLLYAPAGSLVVAGQGTLGEGEIFGRTAMVTPSLSRIGLTGHLLRIQPKEKFSSIAYAFLSSDLGFRLLRSTAVGTKLLSMRPDLLLELPFPDVPNDVAKEVRDAVSVAQSARAEADAAETEAIRIVEEEVLSQWLA